MAGSMVGRSLGSVLSVVAGCDISGLGPDQLDVVTGLARQGQRAFEALLVRVCCRSDELAAKGVGPGSAELLVGRGEVSATQARVEAARVDVVESLPAVGAGLSAGVLGGEHLDVIARATRDLPAPALAALRAQELDVAERAGRLPVDVFSRWFGRLVNRLRHEHCDPDGPREEKVSELRYWRGRDGMGRFEGRLDPLRFEALVAALEAERGALVKAANGSAETADGLVETINEDQALNVEALVGLVTQGGGRSGSARANITLVVDVETALRGPHAWSVSETCTGAPVAAETMRRFACDAVIRKVVINRNGVPIDVGRQHRTATEGQWAALRALYSTCAWYGCDRPIGWCQAHHLDTWEDLGLTDMDNLVPLCSRHHHLVHEGRWRIALLADRALRHYRPDGVYWRTSRPDRLADWLHGITGADHESGPPAKMVMASRSS